MIISYKDIFKMIGITIISFCAVFVCTMFMNYKLDLTGVEAEVVSEASRIFYDAQIMTSKIVTAVSGGCLLLTTVVLICFYIGHYIDNHKKELGILKAIGYSRFQIARRFWVFGLSVLAGTALGYICAHLIMPLLYEMQNKDGFLPDIEIQFHPVLCFLLVILPAVFFAVLSIFYSAHKLKMSPLSLLRNEKASKVIKEKKDSDLSFLKELEKGTVRQKKSLVFFITFAVFCFSSMVQMALSMDELASRMMAVMIMSIGIVLACVTLFIATTSVIRANSKTITMMKVFGYQSRDCAKAVLGGYRPWAYLGFIVGTGYQYMLIKLMVSVVFADVDIVPDYEFNFPALLITVPAFVLLYELIMHIYTKKMEKLSLKEIMLE